MSTEHVAQDLLDEILSLNAIYSDSTFSLAEETESVDGTICILSPPSSIINPAVVFNLRFPFDYPNSSPIILEGTTHGKGLSKVAVTELSRDVLREVWTPGAVVMFDLIEGLKEVLNHPETSASMVYNVENEANASGDNTGNEMKSLERPIHSETTIDKVASLIPWSITPPTIVQKSIFIGRAVRVDSVEQAKEFVNELISTDKKVAKATHNITAWRIKHENGVTFQDYDDDGETAAGSRLAHLLQLIDVWNVMIVVSRWYGGILLGPDRFRIINQVGREALQLGNYIPEAADQGKDKGRGKKGKLN